MKAILEFDLPEDEDRFKLATRGLDYFSALLDIKNELRNHTKYDKEAEKCLDTIEEILYDVILNDIP